MNSTLLGLPLKPRYWLGHTLNFLGCWVLRLLSPLFRWMVRSDAATAPEHAGLRLCNLVSDPNQALYQERMWAAVDLVQQFGPRYLVWLRRHYPTLFIASLRGGTLVQEAHEGGILRFAPPFVWRSTPEEIAIELIAAASRVRAVRASRCPPDLQNDPHLRLLGLRERLRFARRLPNGGALAATWNDRLARRLAAAGPRTRARRMSDTPAT